MKSKITGYVSAEDNPTLHPFAKPNCKQCGGVGKVKVSQGNAPPKEKLCNCTIEKRLLLNADKGWEGISTAPVVSSSPLSEFQGDNLWVTGEIPWMKAHLRHIAIRKPLSWRFKVITDKELMASWLATAALAGVDLLDKEAYEITASKLSIEDLVQPYDLVVFRLGVKAARNSAMPEVLLEALALREHLGLPTWVWDQPTRPLIEGHRCWSMAVRLELHDWKRHSTSAKVSSTQTTKNDSSQRKVKTIRTRTLSDFKGK